MRQKILLLAAVFFGILAFVFTYQQINLEKKRLRGESVDVVLLVANSDLESEHKLLDGDIKSIRVKRSPEMLRSSGELTESQRALVLDRTLAVPIPAGHTLRWSDFKSPVSNGRGGLSALIKIGSRAISIPVDSTRSVAGFVQPNNYVDLIGTFKFPDMKGDTSYDTITLTILQYVRVIATGTDMAGMAAPGQRQSSARGYSTVTLELTPKEVEMIVFATQKGRISLSLRSYEESKVEHDLQSVNWKYLQNNIKEYNKAREDRMNQK